MKSLTTDYLSSGNPISVTFHFIEFNSEVADRGISLRFDRQGLFQRYRELDRRQISTTPYR
ncbi:hypothetical protein D3C80_1416960 [compost metagenome]